MQCISSSAFHEPPLDYFFFLIYTTHPCTSNPIVHSLHHRMLVSLCLFTSLLVTAQSPDSKKGKDFRSWAAQLEHMTNTTLSLVAHTKMPHARYAHTSVLHGDALFVFGGRIIPKKERTSSDDVRSPETKAYEAAKNRLPARDSWMYNITSKQWKVLEFNEKYYAPRLYATSFVYDDRIHIVGGRVDSIVPTENTVKVKQTIPDTINVLNTRTLQWEKPRKFHVRNSYFPTVSGAAVVIEVEKTAKKESFVFLLGGYNAEAMSVPPADERQPKTTARAVSSALTKKYGYYAFHAHNRTQAHVFPAFDTLPIYGHQVVAGPDRTLLVLGGLQRAKEHLSDKKFEDMRPSKAVHLLRHDAFFANFTTPAAAKWPVSALPPMHHARAYFGAVRLTPSMKTREDTDFVIAFGGTDDTHSQRAINFIEILDVQRPERGWRSIEPGRPFPAHIGVAHAMHNENLTDDTYRPVQRIAISGGVSEAHGYHRDLLVFDVKYGSLKNTKEKDALRTKNSKKSSSGQTKLLLAILICCGLYAYHQQAVDDKKRLEEAVQRIRRRLAQAVDAPKNSQKEESSKDPAKEFPERALDPPFAGGPHFSQHSTDSQLAPTSSRHSITEMSGSNLFDSLSSAMVSMHNLDELSSAAPSFSENSQISRPLVSDSAKISNISMPRANVSLSGVPSLSLESIRSTLSSPGVPRTSPLLAQQSPRPQAKNSSNTNVYSDYQLINAIGHGDDAVVYTAVLGSGELVAVKVIHDAQQPTNANLAYYPFTHEAQVLLSLPPHPNLIQFFAIFPYKEKGEIHIVMELIEAGSLHSLLTKITTPFSLATIRKYTQQLIEGLSHLHSNGVVHCDVKGENVLIGIEGQLKLTDFGQSKRFHAVTGENPAENMQRAVHADVWLLGCIIVEMVNRGGDFVTVCALPDDFAAGCFHQDVKGEGEEPQRHRIHCGCCPCLLRHEALLRAKKAAGEEIAAFPFELPAGVEIDASLLDFLTLCFQMENRPNLAALAAHTFMGGEAWPSSCGETGSEGGSPKDKGRSSAENEMVDFSNSLNCTIYEF